MRPIKIIWCWIVGHDHHAAGDYSMCWRCGQIKPAAREGGKQEAEGGGR